MWQVKNWRTLYSIQSSFHLHKFHTQIHRSIQTSIHHHTSLSQGTDLSTHRSIIQTSINTHTHTFIHVYRKEKAEQRFAGASEVWLTGSELALHFSAHAFRQTQSTRAMQSNMHQPQPLSALFMCSLQNKSHQHNKSYYSCKKNVILNIKWQIKAASIHCLPFHFSIPSI